MSNGATMRMTRRRKRMPDLPLPEGDELGEGTGMSELGEQLEQRTGGIMDRFRPKKRD